MKRKVTPDEVRAAVAAGKLTVEEEKVLRMSTGASESGDHELTSRGQGRPLTRMRLAQIERDTLRRMSGDKPSIRQGV